MFGDASTRLLLTNDPSQSLIYDKYSPSVRLVTQDVRYQIRAKKYKVKQCKTT